MPPTARQRAIHESILAEQEQERADLEANAGKEEESIDLDEALPQLKRLALPYPEDSPVSKAVGLVAEAVVSVSEEAVRRRFIRYLRSHDSPLGKREVEWRDFLMGVPAPANDKATHSPDKP